MQQFRIYSAKGKGRGQNIERRLNEGILDCKELWIKIMSGALSV